MARWCAIEYFHAGRPSRRMGVHDAGAAAYGKKPGAKAIKPRDGTLNSNRPGLSRMGSFLVILPCALPELRDDADKILRDVDHQQFDRLVSLAQSPRY